MTIGIRAANAIKAQAAKEGITAKEECVRLKTSEHTMQSWVHGKIPGGFILAEMCRNGYDVIHILIGERKTDE